MEEIVWTMNILLQQGKILYWGTSEWGADELMEAHETAKRLGLIGPSVEQPQYNLFERTNMELDYQPVFSTYGMGTTIWSPLASGLLTGKYNDGIPADSRLALENYAWLKERMMQEEKLERVRNLATLAETLGTSLAILSIAWCLCNPNVTSAILGATKESQLTENLKALEVYQKLTPAILAEIDEIMGSKP
jgi:aryl-alcohol dehydrogenase-like predicted oxidoreductase